MDDLSQLIRSIERYYRAGTWQEFLRRTNKNFVRDTDPNKVAREFSNLALTKNTSFLRDNLRSIFNKIILPRIRDLYPIRILSLPCSDGREVYSLAILSLEAGLRDFKIVGMDISDIILERAIEGRYHLRDFHEIDKVSRYLDPISDSGSKSHLKPNYKIHERLRAFTEFYECDILQQPLPEGYDVIFCLNLLIHLSEEGQEEAIENLTLNMREGDIIVLDGSYHIPPGRLFGKTRKRYQSQRTVNERVSKLDQKPELKLKRLHPRFNIYERLPITP